MQIEQGDRRPEVVELMWQRKCRGSLPGKRNDGFKLGVVIEAGMMLGKVGGAQSAGIEMLGLWNSVDDIYGVSAGAAILAYVIAVMAAEGTMIYSNHLTGLEFINPGRYPIVDISYLTHVVMRDRVILDFERFNDSRIKPHIYVTEAKDGRVVEYTSFESRDQMLDVLHDSCLMPFWAGMPKVRGERAFTDGSVLVGSLPVNEAIKDGCTHILVLRNLPENYRKSQAEMFDAVIKQIIGSRYPNLRDNFHLGYQNKNHALDLIKEMINNPESEIVIEQINPKKIFSALEWRRSKLIAAGKEGIRSVVEKFGRYI